MCIHFLIVSSPRLLSCEQQGFSVKYSAMVSVCISFWFNLSFSPSVCVLVILNGVQHLVLSDMENRDSVSKHQGQSIKITEAVSVKGELMTQATGCRM